VREFITFKTKEKIMKKGIITVVTLVLTLSACGGSDSAPPPVVVIPPVEDPTAAQPYITFYEVTLGTDTVWYRNTATDDRDTHELTPFGTSTLTIEQMDATKTEVVHLVSRSEVTTSLYDPNHETTESITLESKWDAGTGDYTTYSCSIQEWLSSLGGVVPSYAIHNEVFTEVVSDYAECANSDLNTPQYTSVDFNTTVTDVVTLKQVGKSIQKNYKGFTPFPEFANFSENAGLDVSVLSNDLLTGIDTETADMILETGVLIALRQDYWINSAGLGVSTSHAISLDVPYDYDHYGQAVYRNGDGDDSIEFRNKGEVTWLSQGGVAITPEDLL
jgi:hypothetical protein